MLIFIIFFKVENLDRLNIIHVSGTKGKGSTCAFVEIILRRLGYKTGFYSSPHLMNVRERIRINGTPISESTFAQCFLKIYGLLQKLEHPNELFKRQNEMPIYFSLLTIMAFHIFMKENVDVAIIEVGIGGEYDCTNVILNPVVCGITRLDLDHTSILGNTIESIAWHKAGIFKPFSFCTFRLAPRFEQYHWPSDFIEMGIAGEYQRSNVSLAMQLAVLWLKRTKNIENMPALSGHLESYSLDELTLPGFSVPVNFLDALRSCKWPGRSQILRKGSVVYCLDGAHTLKSMESCVSWFLFERKSSKRISTFRPYRILLFHCTGERNPAVLLRRLSVIF
ncbi:unnamed protein product [Dracunculus medinensis]|uniref:tetrahydrofolate synthase n=1 Tax=Dracunculus medinensis TaxID=318479 RepID=A0A3P7Q8A4_DRAME|nr:unnamed protein product [Dracunculus medinensis]